MPNSETLQTPPAQEAVENSSRSSRLMDLMRRPFDVRAFSLTALLVLALFYTIYLTRSLLLPIVGALLLSYLLAPLVRALVRVRVPPMLAAAVVLAIILGVFSYLLSFLIAPAAGWIGKAPYSIRAIEQKLLPLRSPIKKVTEATERIEKITTPDGQQPQVVQLEGERLSDVILGQTPAVLVSIATLIILTFFLLAYDDLFLRKLIKVTPRFEDKKRAVEIARTIEFSISRYLLTITAINVCLGVAVGTAMHLLGMPNPVLWGVMATAFNFVPYIGAFVGVMVLLLAALLSFENTSWALVYPAAYFGLTALEGSFITPMILGRSMRLNPIAIVLSLMFWGWMWGVVGAILAVPLLATFKIFCDQIDPLAPVGEFLGR